MLQLPRDGLETVLKEINLVGGRETHIIEEARLRPSHMPASESESTSCAAAASRGREEAGGRAGVVAGCWEDQPWFDRNIVDHRWVDRLYGQWWCWTRWTSRRASCVVVPIGTVLALSDCLPACPCGAGSVSCASLPLEWNDTYQTRLFVFFPSPTAIALLPGLLLWVYLLARFPF